jgi:glycosyltransferase involved in cell wall biosynthesis
LARVLFVYSRDSSFVSIDREALAEHHRVRDWQPRGARVNPWRLAQAVRRADLVFGWFASWHTFLPVTLAWLMRRPSVMVAGGYDTARMPEIGYGIQQHRLLGPISRWVLRRATRIVTNSSYTAAETCAIRGVDPEKVTVVHHGVPDPFGELPQDGRERLALSVGIVDERNLDRKGLGPFARSAALLPDVRFALVGRWDGETGERLRSQAPPNLEVTGWVDDEELKRWYRRASVYVQPSRHEGFGLSVAEAMLAGCIPVYTPAGALPEVVGETGVAIASPVPEDIAAGVRTALDAGPERRAAARNRVLQEFPLSARRDGLEAAVAAALSGGR